MGNCFVSVPEEKQIKNDKPQIEQAQPKKEEQKIEQIEQSDIQLKVHEDKKVKNQLPDPVSQQKSPEPEDSKKEHEHERESLEGEGSKPETDLKDGEQKKKREKKKMKKVRAETADEEVQIIEKIEKIKRDMTPADAQQNMRSLGNHFVFAQFSESDKEQIIKKMFYCENKEEFVFKQGDQASLYFIIVTGSCEIIINNEVKRVIRAGEGFGELALLYGAPRSASVRAQGACGFWAIDRITFKRAIEELVNREFEENRKFIADTKFFKIMTEDQKDAIAHVTITQVFKKGVNIVNEGDMASSYYIIKKGQVAIIKQEKELRKMGPGDEFGEQALMQNSVRGATVRALEDDVKLLAIGRDQIQIVLGDKYKIDDIIFQLGEIPDKLVFVLESSLKKAKSHLEVATKGNVFGDDWLLKANKHKKIDDNIVMAADGTVAELTFSQFFEIIGGPLEHVLEKNLQSHEVKYMKKADNKDDKKYANLKLEEMIQIKKLGFGQFGSVYLVKNKTDKQFYALKCIQKMQVVEQTLEKHLLQEKKVLESTNFPFIMQFIRTFRDQNNVYFLVEYVKGMELFDVIREIGLLPTYDSQFYIGSLLLCVEYLHTNSIIYRDIKPENIMVDHKGYVKLIDMGTAKFLKGKGGRTFTIIGTPHYMAPEIITGKGYSYSVDLWSLGICLYEFMCGGVPFAEDAEDPYEIYEEIIKKPLVFPGFLKDSNAKKLMHQLLNKTPEMRLGGSYAALKANPWFDNFDWDSLMERQKKPPYVPPKDKLISESEIKKQEALGKSVIEEIKHEQGNVKYTKQSAKDPNWDKEF